MGSVIGLFPMFVILKSMSKVPSGFSSPVGISRSSRIGKSAEWPGVVEPGKGPRPRLGGASCWVASSVNGACGWPNSNNSRAESSAIKTISNFDRFTCFSSRCQRLLKCNAISRTDRCQVLGSLVLGEWPSETSRSCCGLLGRQIRCARSRRSVRLRESEAEAGISGRAG